MRKKSTYLYSLALIVILIASGFALNIHFFKNATISILNMITNPWVCATAAVCAFIFTNHKHYWLINIGCAVITSLIIQFVVLKGGADFYTIALRSLAFLSVVYILNLIKIILTK